MLYKDSKQNICILLQNLFDKIYFLLEIKLQLKFIIIYESNRLICTHILSSSTVYYES